MTTVLALEDPRWRDFVAGHPKASLFHHPAWARLLADCYGYPAHVVVLAERGGVPVAGLPVVDVTRRFGEKRWVSLPFTDACGVLQDDAVDTVTALVDLARDARLEQLELRSSLPGREAVQQRASFVRHEIALGADPTALWRTFRTNHRRSVRDAERAGVRVERGTSARDMENFYRLHLRTRRRLGVPVQPRRFFALVHERLIARGLGFVVTASVGETPVASAIFGDWNGTITYKYGARDERATKLDANHLLFWSAIRAACEDERRTFDLGRSDVDQHSLRSFKSGWGAREESLGYAWIARHPIGAPSRRAEQAMGVVIRHTGTWMCRALGELLYRYAA